MTTKSNSSDVKEFTEGYSGKSCPEKPIPMNRDDVMFLTRMIFSEIDEFAATVCPTEEDKEDFLQEAMNSRDKCKKLSKEYSTEIDLIGSQADALVDSWYYSLNIAAKHGMNLSKLFDVIHTANMNKRDPETGKFIRRESDGKVIKPKGWQPPNIDEEIKKQLQFGSWS